MLMKCAIIMKINRFYQITSFMVVVACLVDLNLAVIVTDRSFSRNCSRSRNRVNYYDLSVAHLLYVFVTVSRNDHEIKQCRVNQDRLWYDLCCKPGHVAEVCIISFSKLKSSQNNRLNNFNNDSNCEMSNSSINFVSDSHYPCNSHPNSYCQSQIIMSRLS